MKTIKTKKSMCKMYVYAFGDMPITRNNLQVLEEHRISAINGGMHCSEISEVELFETVEETIPDVVERWYFVAVYPDGGDKMFCNIERSEMEKTRLELIDIGYSCSEIKQLREEF